MSSPYPVLDNRPIDQWKVAELKDELKRRKLTTKGLKDDLIKRLDEALRNEKDVTSGDADNGFGGDPEDETMDHGDDETEKIDDDTAEVDISDSLKVNEDDTKSGIDSSNVDEPPVEEISVVETVTVSESVVSVVELGGEEAKTSGAQMENGDPNPPLESEDSKPHLENEDSESKPVLMEVKPDSSEPNNQVSEVSPVLGFQVKSDSISTDSVSIRDNVIADNVKLELEVVKAEVVVGPPSSSNVVADGGELLQPMDEDPLEKRESVEEIDSKNAANVDTNKKNDSADVGSSEKLNLDRSSGDDSMEEDATESKIIESKYNFDEVEDNNKNEPTELPVVEKRPVDVVMDDLPAEKKDVVENKKTPAVPAEKRKLHDSEPIVTNEPSKRQRRWSSESLKVPEPQSSSLTPSTTPKETFQPTPLKRNFSRTDSNLSDDTPKERVVPPSTKPPTNSLRIDRFLRPFTLKAVNELLGKTGSVTCFWMDHIKTHCYVTYSSVEEATETRNAVYNLQWPPNGGRLLIAEFVDPHEVKSRAEAPAQPLVSPAGSAPTLPPPPPPPTLLPQPSPRQQQQALRQQQQQQLPPPPASLPPPPPLTNPPPVRERLHLPPPPPLPEKLDPPIVTLDDLFRKTKATPRIYYLPLSEEQVAAKVEAKAKNKQ